MTAAERGRLGGLATHRKHGSAHMRMIGRRGSRGLVNRYNGDARAAREHLLASGKLCHPNRCAAYWKEVITSGRLELSFDAWEGEQRVMAARALARERTRQILEGGDTP